MAEWTQKKTEKSHLLWREPSGGCEKRGPLSSSSMMIVNRNEDIESKERERGKISSPLISLSIAATAAEAKREREREKKRHWSRHSTVDYCTAAVCPVNPSKIIAESKQIQSTRKGVTVLFLVFFFFPFKVNFKTANLHLFWPLSTRLPK